VRAVMLKSVKRRNVIILIFIFNLSHAKGYG
jgi:hypothetical protein